MFEVSDEKYAVKNANEAVINAADKVIDSNNNNGVSRYLSKLYSNSKMNANFR